MIVLNPVAARIKDRPRAVMLLAAWIGAVAVQLISPLWYPTPDACMYLSIARSIKHFPNVTNLGSGNLIFGVGYPLSIAPAFLIDDAPFLWVSLIGTFWLTIYFAGIVAWAKLYVPEGAVLIAMVAIGNVVVLSLYRRALSEVAFCGTMIWLSYFMARAQRAGRCEFRSLIAAAALVAYLAMIRPTGILWGLGFGLQLLVGIKRKALTWREALPTAVGVIAPAVLILGATLVYGWTMAAREQGWTNLDVFAATKKSPPTDFPPQPVWQQCIEGLRVRISEVGRVTLPGMFDAYGRFRVWFDFNMAVYLPLFGLFLCGWLRFVRRFNDAFAWTLPLYFGLHIYWPFNQSGRYFAPLAPMMWICFWLALEPLGKRRLGALRILILLHLLVAAGHWWANDRPWAVALNRQWQDIEGVLTPAQGTPARLSAGPGVGYSVFLAQYVLDRPVLLLPSSASLADDVVWRLEANDADPPEHFQFHAAAGFWRLYKRE